MTNTADPLWTHFKPLWLDFQKAGEGVLVAGGYGLFLKQQYMLGKEAPTIAIPMERWPDPAPRATGDMDLIVALDLIADDTANKRLFTALEEQGFVVSEKPHGKRWQYFKEIGKGQHVVVELHAPLPGDDNESENLQSNRFAVKHKPSLGEQGVHGRTNQEAIGSELHPFRFEMEGIKVAVPNPVTWTVMKLTAAEDTWKRSLDEKWEPKDRRHFRQQAIKHGHDACRAVAMMTIEERDSSAEVIEAIRETTPFMRASEIYRNFFNGEDGWADEVLKGRWLTEDMEVIQAILASWYSA
jgi:hypothetical protein